MRFGRRALAKGARPVYCETRREVFDAGNLLLSMRGPVVPPLTYRRTVLEKYLCALVANHLAERRCCRRAARGWIACRPVGTVWIVAFWRP